MSDGNNRSPDRDRLSASYWVADVRRPSGVYDRDAQNAAPPFPFHARNSRPPHSSLPGV